MRTITIKQINPRHLITIIHKNIQPTYVYDHSTFTMWNLVYLIHF